MRIAIRLLAVGTLILFVLANVMAQHGEQAQGTEPGYRWPGLFEFLMLWVILALTLLLSTIASVHDRVCPGAYAGDSSERTDLGD